MSPSAEPEVLESLVRIYSFCKRLLLHTHWQNNAFTVTQRLVLLTAAGCGRLTMTHLADTIACSKEQATRAVAPLVQSGYLTRIYDQENRTRVLIELTPKGRQLIRQQYQSCAQELHTLFASLSPEDRQRLGQSLKAVYQLWTPAPSNPPAGESATP